MRKIITIIALLLGMSSLAWAGPMGPGGPHGPGPDMLKTWIELNLNDAQRKEAATILKGYRQEIQDRKEAVHKAFEQAGKPGDNLGKFDEKLCRKNQAAISSAMTEMIVLREKIVSELYAILTPAQQEIVKTKLVPPMPPQDGEKSDGKPGDKPGEEGPDGGPKFKDGPGPHHGHGGPGFGGPGPDGGLELIDAFIEANS